MPVSEVNPPKPKPVSRGIVVPNQPRWFQRLAARIVFTLIRLVSMTLRYRWNDRSGLFDGAPAGPAIYCVWHNRLALCLEVYFRFVKKHNQTPGMAAIVSASKDGALLASVLECFKVQPVRGSSSRRGAQALLELKSWSDRGYDIAFTPDGPRGPRYVAHPGIISLAQVTGLAVVPVSYNLSWKIQLKSWDAFQIPLPFSRCDVFLEKAIRVPRVCPPEKHEAMRLELESALKAVVRD